MKRLLKIIDSISDWSGRIFAYLLWPGVAVLVYEVVARYVFNAPTIWAHGTTQRIFAVYYFICGAYISLNRSHITMDIIYERFSPRKKAILDIISFILFLCFLLVSYCGTDPVMLGLSTDTTWNLDSTPFRAPLYPIKLMIPLGALLIILQELANLWRNVYVAITGESYEH